MSTDRRGYPKRISATLPKHIEKINAPCDSDRGRKLPLQAGRTIVGGRLYAIGGAEDRTPMVFVMGR